MTKKKDPFEKMELGMDFAYSPRAPLPEHLARIRGDFLELNDENLIVKEVYAAAGLALYSAQCFEVEVQLAILTVKRARRHFANIEEYDALQNELTGKTLGQLLREARRVLKVNEDAENLLKSALDSRNSLAHGFFEVHSMDFVTGQGRLRMLDDLLERIRLFQVAEKLANGITTSMMHYFGVTDEIARKKFSEALQAAREADGEGGLDG